jgi:hypothetical protein
MSIFNISYKVCKMAKICMFYDILTIMSCFNINYKIFYHTININYEKKGLEICYNYIYIEC